MKVGCALWLFSPMDRPTSDEESIRTIAELGFDGVELLLRNRRELDAYWTPTQTQTIRDLVAHHGLTASQLVVRWEAISGFADEDAPTHERALGDFERACRLARALGTDTVCTISSWPASLTVPTVTLPNYWVVNPPGWDRPKLKIVLPERFEWEASWQAYVESIRRMATIARANDVRFAVENHTNTMSSHTDSLLRLFDRVQDNALGANFDVGFAFIQREAIPWAIHKLRDRLFHIHARDGDGFGDYLQPVGAGILDWEGIVEALRDVGYDGFISMEWPRRPDNGSRAREALGHLREQIARLT